MLSGVFAFLMFALLKYLMLHLSLRWTQWNRGLRLVEHGTVLANPSQVSDHCCWIQAVKSPWPPAHCFSWTCSDSSALIWFISDWLRRAAGGRQGRRHRLFSSVVRYIQMFIFTTSYLAVLESFLAKTWGAEFWQERRIISASQHFQFSRQPVELLGHSIEQWCPRATSGNTEGLTTAEQTTACSIFP